MSDAHSYIDIVEDNAPPLVSRTTKRFYVKNKGTHMILGTIKWYAPWRKYCFFPSINTIFEEKCMREVSDFIVEQTAAQHK